MVVLKFSPEEKGGGCVTSLQQNTATFIPGRTGSSVHSRKPRIKITAIEVCPLGYIKKNKKVNVYASSDAH